jgi:hypothetical protein
MALVFVKEEYGFRHYIWRTPMIEQDVVAWWQGVVKAPQPDDLTQIFPGSELLAVFSDDVDQWVDESHNHIFLHLHRDDDSFMRLPSGKEIHHAGYEDDNDFSWVDG